MGYKVLERFEDTDGRVYVKGERYSQTLDEGREITLTTGQNKYHKPFLKKLGGIAPLSNTQEQAEDTSIVHYEDCTVAELKKIADKIGIPYNSKIRKDELVEIIVSNNKSK